MELVQSFVQLPDPIRNSIIGLVTALFALGFNFLIARVPWLEFLRKYQQEWAVALAMLFINFIEQGVPDQYGDLAIKGLDFLLALVAFFVVYIFSSRAFAKKQINGFR